MYNENDRVFLSGVRTLYISYAIAFLVSLLLLGILAAAGNIGAGYLVGISWWIASFLVIGVAGYVNRRTTIYSSIKKYAANPNYNIHQVKDEIMLIPVFFYAIGTVIWFIAIFSIFFTPIAPNETTFTPALFFSIVMLFLIPPVAASAVFAQKWGKQHEDEDDRSWKRARRHGAFWGIVFVTTLGYITYKVVGHEMNNSWE